MTGAELAAIRARCEAATAGPWAESFRGLSITVHQAGGEFIADLHPDEPTLLRRQREQDAVFIAHVRADVPALLAEVERLRACFAATVALEKAVVEAYNRYAPDPLPVEVEEELARLGREATAKAREAMGHGDRQEVQA